MMLKNKKIKSIKKIGKRKVYDIKVEDNHNFILSNNILSHNSETRGLISGQSDMTVLGSLPSEADRSLATDQLYRDGLINKKQIIQIGQLNPGQFIICPTGKPAYYAYVLLPKSRYWQEKNGNFYKNIWEKEVGHWMNFEETLARLKAEKEELKEKRKKDKEEKIKRDLKVTGTGVLPEEIEQQFNDPLNTRRTDSDLGGVSDEDVRPENTKHLSVEGTLKTYENNTQPEKQELEIEVSPSFIQPEKEIKKEISPVENPKTIPEPIPEQTSKPEDNNIKKVKKRLTSTEMMKLAIMGKLNLGKK